MFCPKCGKQLPEGAKFCNACGAKIEASSAEPATESKTQLLTSDAPVQPKAEPQPSPQPIPQPAPQATPQPTAAQPQVDFKGEISKLQGKLDNTNSSFLKGRSLWDVVGLCAVVLMIVSFFLPVLKASSTYTGTISVSLMSLMSMMGTSSYTSSFSMLVLVYLFPAVCCALDLLITKENSTRHIRLIILGVLNFFLASSISGVVKLGSSVSELASAFSSSANGAIQLGIGYYLSVIGSVVIIAIGIVGIYEKKKGKIAK